MISSMNFASNTSYCNPSLQSVMVGKGIDEMGCPKMGENKKRLGLQIPLDKEFNRYQKLINSNSWPLI